MNASREQLSCRGGIPFEPALEHHVYQEVVC